MKIAIRLIDRRLIVVDKKGSWCVINPDYIAWIGDASEIKPKADICITFNDIYAANAMLKALESNELFPIDEPEDFLSPEQVDRTVAIDSPPTARQVGGC